jgi:hypothetical protein
MNFNDPDCREKQLRRIRERCAELPPPPEANLSDKCWIPESRLNEKLEADNIYSSGKFLGKNKGLHQITWMLATGHWREHSEDGLEVMHLCNVKCCCNPNHLKLGTRKENNAAAIADGLFDPRGQKGIPKPFQKGELNCRAKATEPQIAEIKWLIENRHEWWKSALRSRYKTPWAVLAIVYQLSEASIKQTRRAKSWPHVQSVKPKELPTAEKIPADAKPPCPKKDGPIGPENAALILRGYWQSENKPRYISEWMKKLGVSRISIQKVLLGETWSEIEPTIQRESNFDNHRPRSLSDRDVQAIRATYAEHSGRPRIKRALAERFGCEHGYVTHIVEGVVRKNVPPDPIAALPLEELDLKPRAQHGQNHKLAELNPDQVWAILTRLTRNDKVLDRVILLSQEFGVSVTVIYGIRSRNRYKEICKEFDYEQLRHKRNSGEEAN